MPPNHSLLLSEGHEKIQRIFFQIIYFPKQPPFQFLAIKANALCTPFQQSLIGGTRFSTGNTKGEKKNLQLEMVNF